MQADGGSVTCRSSSLGSAALTDVDYAYPVLSPHLLGKHDPLSVQVQSSAWSARMKELKEALTEEVEGGGQHIGH